MHLNVKKMISICDIPEDVLQKVVDVLKNDLKEYESLDQDFGEGTEAAIQEMIKTIESGLNPSSS